MPSTIIKQTIKFTLIGYLFVSVILPVAASSSSTIFENVSTAFRRVFHPFKTAGEEFKQQQLEMIKDKRLTLKGVIVGEGAGIESAAIKFFSRSPYSHCMLVLENQNNPQEAFCYQSRGSFSQVLKFIWPQVYLTPYHTEVTNYNGKLSQRNFEFDEGISLSSDDLGKSVRKYLGRSYELNLLEGVKAFLRSNTHENPRQIFCSELMPLVLQDLKLMENTPPANNYLPYDFAEGFDSYLHLKGAKLGKQFPLPKTLPNN